MGDILIRGLDDELIDRIKRRARSGGRSLQAELRAMIEQAARLDPAEARRVAARFRRQFGAVQFDDSADLIREDRDR